MVLRDLQDLRIKKVYDPGNIRNGIKQLEQRKDIVIRPVDKGGAIVIQSKEAYKNELNRQIQNENTDQK